MKQYHIFHATENKFDETEKQNREYVGMINANSLEDAFNKTQNVDDVWNSTNPCRSTSVGDVIQDDEGFHMVCARGFKTLALSFMIILFLSSCTSYKFTPSGPSTICGEWHPKKFENDRRMRAINREIRIRNGWNKHY